MIARFLLLILISLFSISCTKGNSLQKEYGENDSYFRALLLLKDDSQSEKAIPLLKASAKKGSPLIARRSLEQLALLSPQKERLKYYKKIFTDYNDSSALLNYICELEAQQDYGKIISLTDNLSPELATDKITAVRINALLYKKDLRCGKEFLEWCFTKPYTAEHEKVYRQLSAEIPGVEFRSLVFNRKYSEAYKNLKIILGNKELQKPQLFSDAGKAALYGSKSFLENAYYFSSLAENAPLDCKFYSYFYSGRLFEKASDYNSQALLNFQNAMNFAETPLMYDNALWYYLETSLKKSIPSALDALKTYGHKWNDPFYFDDFLSTLSLRLISQHMWKEYIETAGLISTFASKESKAKFAYVSARLLQLNYLPVPENIASEQARSFFTMALDSGNEFYYKLLAASQLGFSKEQYENLILSYGTECTEPVNYDASVLLKGYADYGLPELIYDEWKNFPLEITMDCSLKISQFLFECGKENEIYYPQSLRISSRKVNYPETKINREMLCLSFPKCFGKTVEKYSEEYNIESYLLFALLRSESFFDAKISSSAGAVGLAQLMPLTASDVARKLKIEDYSLTDAQTSIQFGTFYLEEMIRRLDGQKLLAAFSYNAGISKVRNLYSSAKIEMQTDNIPMDIFLEALPIEETKEYGRKIVSASCLYAYLYNSKLPSQVIAEIFTATP